MNARLQVFSDLHLELYPRKDRAKAALQRHARTVPEATACILAGDVAVPTGNRRRWLDIALKFFSERYEQVFYVPGNHEFYGAPAAFALEKIRDVVHDYPKVTLLEPGVTARWNGRRVLGATLWFRHTAENERNARFLSDFGQISEFVPWVYEQNREHVAWLNEQVGAGDIVVTHHLPSRRSVAAQYEGDALNAFFLCDVERLIDERQPALWVHGHTHEAFRYQIGPTTVLCNPLGYRGQENRGFDTGVWEPPPHPDDDLLARALAMSGASAACGRPEGHERLPFSECLADVGTPAGRNRLKAVLDARPFPHFEPAPGRRGLLVKIEQDGTRTIGRFVNRNFVPVDDDA